MANILTENERRLVEGITVRSYYNDYIVPLDPKKYRPMADVPGKGGAGVCPFHSDTDPSFHDWREKKLFRCFGCGTAGNIIRLHQLTKSRYHNEQLSKDAAMRDLARLYNIELELDEKGEIKVESPFDRAKKKLMNPDQYRLEPTKLTITRFRSFNNQAVNTKHLSPIRRVSAYLNLDMMLAAFFAQQKEMSREEEK